MDNRKMDLYLEGKDDFILAMSLAVNKRKVIGWRVQDNKLILYWAKSEKMQAHAYEMNLGETTNFAWGWLERNNPANKQPDHDGDNEKGFRIYNDSWGHVFGEWQAFIAIEPIWAMCGK